ncbi:protein DEK isoform X2 [Myxocyprinus asiaticus]|uniref:protein DEK isoform X2 n=1 Tax=Myxocyprinus asiaticus TaxID=70543 RepID=UPI002221F1BD|nr:protein DEK isoform X2 [Myxocyprinus asiaticus]
MFTAHLQHKPQHTDATKKTPNMSEAMETVKAEDHSLDENSTKEEEMGTLDDGSGKPKSKMYQGEILEGKREKKGVQRLSATLTSKPKEKFKIESTGQGAKLGDIARVNHSIGKLKAPLLKPLHKILYDRPGAASSLRKNLRLFNGFPFEADSDLYNKKKEKVTRLPKSLLRTICQTLDLERSGTQIVLVERIMNFLVCPTNSGKPVIKKKKRKTTKDAKREKKSSSKSKKTQKVESGKSKAIVSDSSSDDDDDDEEERKEKNKGTEKSATVSQKRKDSDSKSSDKEEDDDEEDDDDDDSKEDHMAPVKDSEEELSSKKKYPSKKATKKSDEKTAQSASDEENSDQDLKKTKKPAAKRKAPAKPVPKTKKADSSSNRGKKKESKCKDESDSSDDDQPLIKIVKKPPTDDHLKETIQDLLKDANLEEVTMKQLCRQVYDKYPHFDLTSRKEFIKDTVKSLIS